MVRHNDGTLKFKSHLTFKDAVAAAYAEKAKQPQTVSDVVKRCKLWFPIFCPGVFRREKTTGCRQKFSADKQIDTAEAHKMPGDAEAIHNHAVTPASVKMFQQEPSTIPASLQLKYPFQKRDLVRAWHRGWKKKEIPSCNGNREGQVHATSAGGRCKAAR